MKGRQNNCKHCEAVVCLKPLVLKSEYHLSDAVDLYSLTSRGQLLNIKENINRINGNTISNFAHDS